MKAIYANTGQEVKLSLKVADGLREEEVREQHEHLKRVGFLKEI